MEVQEVDPLVLTPALVDVDEPSVLRYKESFGAEIVGAPEPKNVPGIYWAKTGELAII